LDGNKAYTECIHDVSIVEPQVRLGKDRIGKVSVGEDRIVDEDINVPTKPTRHKYGRYQNVLLTDEELDKLKAEFPRDWGDRIERLSEYIASTGKRYKSHLATIRSWARKDGQKKQTTTKSSNPFLDMLVEEGYE